MASSSTTIIANLPQLCEMRLFWCGKRHVVAVCILVLLALVVLHQLRGEPLQIVENFVAESKIAKNVEVPSKEEKQAEKPPAEKIKCADLTPKEKYRFPGAKRLFSNAWEAHLKELGLDEESISKVDDGPVLKSRPAFGTAFSDNHYTEGRRLLRTIRANYPDDVVHLYNLGISGLEKKKADFLSDNPKTVFHEFNFSRYPDYVRDLVQYRWKPLIITEMLKEFKSVVWMDASIQWKNANLSFAAVAAGIRRGSSPIQMLVEAGHSIYSTTHPNTYDFFGLAPLTVPIAENAPDRLVHMKELRMFGANFIIFFGTQKALRDIVYWWILCALERDCMGPKGTQIYCNFKDGDRWTKFADCHRYDQADINMLLWHANCYNTTLYKYADSGNYFLT